MKIYPEDTFTQSNNFCKNPQYWHSTDEDSTEIEVSELVAAFIRALQPEYVIETGTAFGQTTELIGKALIQNKHGRLISLEIDPQRVLFSKKRCTNLPVQILNISSLEFIPEEQIDFIWLDSLLQLRVKEFLKFFPFFTESTIIGFHDTAPHHILLNYLQEIKHLIKPIFLHTPRGVCFAQPILNKE